MADEQWREEKKLTDGPAVQILAQTIATTVDKAHVRQQRLARADAKRLREIVKLAERAVQFPLQA